MCVSHLWVGPPKNCPQRCSFQCAFKTHQRKVSTKRHSYLTTVQHVPKVPTLSLNRHSLASKPIENSPFWIKAQSRPCVTVAVACLPKKIRCALLKPFSNLALGKPGSLWGFKPIRPRIASLRDSNIHRSVARCNQNALSIGGAELPRLHPLLPPCDLWEADFRL